MSRLPVLAVLLCLMIGLFGCGGDDETVPPSGPRPSPDDAAITGRVVQADNVAVGLARAVIREASTGLSTESDNSGAFLLRGLPAGNVVITVETPMTPDYEGATITVPTTAHGTTTVNVAVLPVSLGTPTALFIEPLSPVVEQGGQLQFRAAIYVGTRKISAQPTWILSGNQIGTIEPNGLLRAGSAGTGLLTAVAGGIVRSTGIVVTGALPPMITTVLLSAGTDVPLPASGGTITITAAISDGNGIRVFDSGSSKGLKFEIYTPDGDVIELTPGEPVAGNIYDGTWRASFTVPPNSNVPDPNGTQAPQVYSVRVAARDLTGAQSYSHFVDFFVAGVDAPPPQP